MTFQYQGGVKMEDVEDRRESTPPGLIRRGWKKDKEVVVRMRWEKLPKPDNDNSYGN